MRFRNMITILVCYVIAGFIITWLFRVVTCNSLNPHSISLYDVVALGGIFATFGSALLATIVIYEQGNERQLKENVGILYEGILKQEEWKRWSFFERTYVFRTLDGEKMTSRLSNPKLPFDVGTHEIQINLPTISKDFYDLPIFTDFLTMAKYRKAFYTTYGNKKEEGIGDKLLAFECVFDILKCANLCKILNRGKHISIGLISWSIIACIVFICYPNILITF